MLTAAAQQLKELAGRGETRLQLPGLTSDRLLGATDQGLGESGCEHFCALGGKWHLCLRDLHSPKDRRAELAPVFRAGSLVALVPSERHDRSRNKRGDIVDGIKDDIQWSGFDTRLDEPHVRMVCKLRPIQLPVGVFVQLAHIHKDTLKALDLGEVQVLAKDAHWLKGLSELRR